MKKQALSKFLPREPRKISENIWFYLEPKGIEIIHQTAFGTIQTLMSWAKVEKALNDFFAAKNYQSRAVNFPKKK